MTTEQALALGAIIFVAMIAIIVFTVIYDLKKNKAKYDKEAKEYAEKKFAEEAEVTTMHAEILDMVCGTGMVGSYLLPKSEKTFLIIFKTDGGESLELRVPEEYYLELKVGQKGMLTIVEGNLDSFELEEG
ncbi:MAG: DUF2500 family protein [Clostridia bacterium]|nr:DUF2500 family protein [Clostridia bacterium]